MLLKHYAREHITGNGSHIILKSASDMTVNQAVLAKKMALRKVDVTPSREHFVWKKATIANQIQNWLAISDSDFMSVYVDVTCTQDSSCGPEGRCKTWARCNRWITRNIYSFLKMKNLIKNKIEKKYVFFIPAIVSPT